MVKKNVKVAKSWYKDYTYYVISVLAIVLVAFLIYGLSYAYDLSKDKNVVDTNYGNMSGQITFADLGDKVSVNYSLEVDGKIIDSSYDKNEPLEFTIGSGSMIKGFEDGIIGMRAGDTKTFIIEPKDGYGANPPKDINYPMSALVLYANQSGSDYNAQTLVNQRAKFTMGSNECTVTSYYDSLDTATLKCSHPLASKSLKFTVQMLDINKGLN